MVPKIYIVFVCLFDLTFQSTIFQFCRGGPSWINQYEARINVSFSRTQDSDASKAQPAALSHKSSTLPLSHCAPRIYCIVLRNEFDFWKDHGIMNTLGLFLSKGLTSHIFARDPKYSKMNLLPIRIYILL